MVYRDPPRTDWYPDDDLPGATVHGDPPRTDWYPEDNSPGANWSPDPEGLELEPSTIADTRYWTAPTAENSGPPRGFIGDVPAASWGRRIGATVIDYAVLFGPAGVLGGIGISYAIVLPMMVAGGGGATILPASTTSTRTDRHGPSRATRIGGEDCP